MNVLKTMEFEEIEANNSTKTCHGMCTSTGEVVHLELSLGYDTASCSPLCVSLVILLGNSSEMS